MCGRICGQFTLESGSVSESELIWQSPDSDSPWIDHLTTEWRSGHRHVAKGDLDGMSA